MSYLVLARKYRPAGFESVVGQDHVTVTLQNAIKRDKVAHAHVFSGPRGVGKTSIARIFAKALNCIHGPTPNPCLECLTCKEITQGISLAVREIDGASHNSVDNVRELIDSFRSLPPPPNKFKVYIIDEVHMLSTAAFNALLKSLEEPPPNTVFILATTEIHKIPETVLSRCQRHELRALETTKVFDRLRSIVEGEKVRVDEEVLRMVSRLSEESLRDAQTLLERLLSFCDDKVTAAEASEVLGVTERKVLFEITDAVLERDSAKALSCIHAVFSAGIEPGVFLRDFVHHWRELFFAKFGSRNESNALGVSDDEFTELTRRTEALNERDLYDLVNLARNGADAAIRSYHVRLAVESLVVRMALREPVMAVKEVLERLSPGTRGTVTHTPPVNTSSSKAVASTTRVLKDQVEKSISTDETATVVKEALFEWFDFVRSCDITGGKIFFENLKRLSAVQFSPGRVELVGPKFCIDGFKNAATKKKLEEKLESYSGIAEWNIVLRTQDGTGTHEDKSLEGTVKKEQETQLAHRAKEIQEHPSIQSLQKAFPGSTIEVIKVKE